MAYNYDPNYLVRNKDLVAKIVRVVQSGELLSYEANDWSTIATHQRKVNNILANMSRNMVDYRDIRTTVRSWTEFSGERYLLYVGRPEHKVQGRPPGWQQNNAWKERYVAVGTNGNIYVHPGTLDDAESLATFVGKVMNLPLMFKRAEVTVEDLKPEDIPNYFGDIFNSYGWSVSNEGGTLILERT